MKLLESVLDTCSNSREMVDTDDMQSGFMPSRGTTNSTLIVHQLQEKFIAGNKPLHFVFVDLEKAFDWVPKRSCGGP